MIKNRMLKISRVSLKRKICYNSEKISVFLNLIMLLFCISVVKTGFEYYNFSLSYQLITVLFITLFFVKKIKLNTLKKIKELYYFIIVFMIEIPIHFLLDSGYYNIMDSIQSFVIYVMMIIVLIVILNNDKYCNKFWKIVNIIVCISSFLIIIQEIFYLCGIRLDNVNYLSLLFKGWKFSFYRPCGPFSEPSHFAEMALLSMYYYLFVKINYKAVSLILCALFLSTSSLGILGGIIIIIMHIVNIGLIKNIKKRIRVSIYLVSIILCVIGVLVVSSIDNVVIKRVLNGGTISLRVFRSFELYDELPLEYKVFGIGMQNQSNYLNYNNIILPSDNEETLNNREYAQTFGYILCCTGLIGCISFWGPFIKNMRRNNIRVNMFILLFGIISLTSCILTRTIFLLYLLAYFSLKEIFKEKKI